LHHFLKKHQQKITALNYDVEVLFHLFLLPLAVLGLTDFRQCQTLKQLASINCFSLTEAGWYISKLVWAALGFFI
jgi:hypothetical protein